MITRETVRQRRGPVKITNNYNYKEVWKLDLYTFLPRSRPVRITKNYNDKDIESLILGDLGTTKGTSDEKEKITKWKFLLAPGWTWIDLG